MANNRLSELTISFVKRNARERGPTSSEAWNDSIDELGRDLTTLYNEWNNSLIPLLSLLPHRDLNYNVDAFTDGLDGRTLFVNADASTTSADKYFNAGLVRPNTVYEQFQNVYSALETRVNVVQEQIDNVALSASDIPISDDGSVFTSGTVEDALQEVMNLVTKTGSDHGSLIGLGDDDHTQYLPVTGSRSMTGNLNLGGHNVSNVSTLTATTLNSFSGLSVTGNSGTIGWSSSGAILKGSTINAFIQVMNIAQTQTVPLYFSRPVSSHINSNTVDAGSGNNVFKNQSGGGAITIFNLPTLTANTVGLTYTFIVDNSIGVRVVASAGQTIRKQASLSASGGKIESTTVGNVVTLVAYTSSQWIVINSEGSGWTVT